MSKKKLIIFMPSIEKGGVEKNLFIISNYLGKMFSNSILITASKSFNHRFYNLKLINPKINVETLLYKKIKYFFCIMELIKLILKDNNYLVLAFQANLYCALICKIFRIKVIVRSNTSPSGWKLNFVRRVIFYFFLRLPNKIIVNSKKFKREYKVKFGINAKCIYNPLNTEYIKKLSKKKINNNFFKNFKKLKIIFIGRLVDQKDPFTFLKALELLKKKIDFRAVIIGSGYYYKNLKMFLSEKKLKNKVRMINWQNNPYPYLKASDVLILTSKYEGLPNVLLEAISLRKHVISSDCPTGPREILDNGKGGELFNVGNFPQLANKISLLNEYKKRYAIKSRHAHKRLVRFDYKKNLILYFNEIRKEMK